MGHRSPVLQHMLSVCLSTCLSVLHLPANQTKCYQRSNCQCQDAGMARRGDGGLSALGSNILHSCKHTDLHLSLHTNAHEYSASLCHYHIHQLCKELSEQSCSTFVQTHSQFPQHTCIFMKCRGATHDLHIACKHTDLETHRCLTVCSWGQRPISESDANKKYLLDLIDIYLREFLENENMKPYLKKSWNSSYRLAYSIKVPFRRKPCFWCF